jgi:hypothetical protein
VLTLPCLSSCLCVALCCVRSLSIIIHNCNISRLLWRFDGRLQRRHSENPFRPQASQRTTKNVKRPTLSLSKHTHLCYNGDDLDHDHDHDHAGSGAAFRTRRSRAATRARLSPASRHLFRTRLPTPIRTCQIRLTRTGALWTDH